MHFARDIRIVPPAGVPGRVADILAAAARAEPSSGTGRVLRLSGSWTMPGDVFSFEAILSVAAGRANGPIHWTRDGVPQLSGIEVVRGSLAATALEIGGVSAGPGLACDQYRIALDGDGQSGAFSGFSRAFGGWDGRLRGEYRFSDEDSAP